MSDTVKAWTPDQPLPADATGEQIARAAKYKFNQSGVTVAQVALEIVAEIRSSERLAEATRSPETAPPTHFIITEAMVLAGAQAMALEDRAIGQEYQGDDAVLEDYGPTVRQVLLTSLHPAAPETAETREGVKAEDALSSDMRDLLDRFNCAVREKLARSQAKYGYTDDWADAERVDRMQAALAAHIAKGDPVDVVAYCAFLWHHGASIDAHSNDLLRVIQRLRTAVDTRWGDSDLDNDETELMHAMQEAALYCGSRLQANKGQITDTQRDALVSAIKANRLIASTYANTESGDRATDVAESFEAILAALAPSREPQ